jgi:hypothetical protein
MSSENTFIVKALTKLMNSNLIKDVYPKLDSIEIKSLNLDKGSMSLNIVVDVPNMTYENMYDNEFDPHYLVEYHIKRLLPYVGVVIPEISWDVITTDGKYVAGFEKDNGYTI